MSGETGVVLIVRGWYMSPNEQAQGKNVKVPDNIYTVILAVATCAVAAVAAFVLFMCYKQYGTIFKMP